MESRGYAKNNGVHIAYSVSGEGPVDVLALSGYTIAMESFAEEPHAAAFDRRLASFCRLMRFDRRGIGFSDPMDLTVDLTLEAMASDAVAVLDALGVEHATLLADDGAVPIAITLAAMAPARVDRLVLVNGYARTITADDYPYGHPPELVSSFVETNSDPEAQWTSDDGNDRALIAPSLQDDPGFAEWWVRASHRGASPRPRSRRCAPSPRATCATCSRASRCRRWSSTAPRTSSPRSDAGAISASNIAGAKYVELPGADRSRGRATPTRSSTRSRSS